MSIVLIDCDHGGQIHTADYDEIDDDEQELAEIAARQEVELPDHWWVGELLCDGYERALRMTWGAFFDGTGVRVFDGVEEHGEMEDGMGVG
ncbi:hypothetical protein [Streptomyces sp. Wb2n-11]|uniref:hypothetical protein n=1 Tax=Streptomyces sp. Wb2n-11 TaxID=1030533 RepID=UPI000A9593E1|nr:hypothetical protein [Streptomyces sp. Wb2n-11]